jgi:hypothetical protein
VNVGTIDVDTVAAPLFVIVNALVEPSTIVGALQVSKLVCVPVIAWIVGPPYICVA